MTDEEHPVIAWRRALAHDADLSTTAALPSTARLVGHVFALFVNHSGLAWPSTSTLATGAGLSGRAVRTQLRALESAGWLQVVQRGGVIGGPKTSVYKILTPAAAAGVTVAVVIPTPAPDAGVDATTPASHDTTPASHDTTPARPSAELEELEELEQQQRRTAKLIGLALAGRPGVANPAGYAAAVARKILEGPDRERIASALADGQAPEAIAERWQHQPQPTTIGPRPARKPACSVCLDHPVGVLLEGESTPRPCPSCSQDQPNDVAS